MINLVPSLKVYDLYIFLLVRSKKEGKDQDSIQ